MESSGEFETKISKSVLQGKLSALAIQIGYMGKQIKLYNCFVFQ